MAVLTEVKSLFRLVRHFTLFVNMCVCVCVGALLCVFPLWCTGVVISGEIVFTRRLGIWGRV